MAEGRLPAAEDQWRVLSHEDAPTLDKKFKHDIDVVVDRLVTRGEQESRYADSIEQALRLADGIAGYEQVLITAAVLGDVPDALRAHTVHIRAGHIVEPGEDA